MLFRERNFVAHFIQLKLSFIPKPGKLGFSTPHLGELGTTHDLRWWLVGKRVGDLLFVIIELFLLARTVETLQAEICRRGRFLKGVGHFGRPFYVEGDVAHQPLLGGRKLEGLPFHVV